MLLAMGQIGICTAWKYRGAAEHDAALLDQVKRHQMLTRAPRSQQ